MNVVEFLVIFMSPVDKRTALNSSKIARYMKLPLLALFGKIAILFFEKTIENPWFKPCPEVPFFSFRDLKFFQAFNV